MKKKVVFFVMCALLTFLFSTTAYAYNLTGYLWSSSSIKYYYDNFNSSASKNAISNAAYAWSGVDASLSFSAINNVYCLETYQPYVIWDGITVSTTEFGYFTSQTMQLNTAKRAYSDSSALKSVAAHEFGHVFGLNEYSASKTIMNDYTWGPNSRYETYGLTTPQNDDKNGVNYLY